MSHSSIQDVFNKINSNGAVIVGALLQAMTLRIVEVNKLTQGKPKFDIDFVSVTTGVGHRSFSILVSDASSDREEGIASMEQLIEAKDNHEGGFTFRFKDSDCEEDGESELLHCGYENFPEIFGITERVLNEAQLAYAAQAENNPNHTAEPKP